MSVAERYDYEFDPAGTSAGAHVLRLVGTDQRVLEIGAGPGSIARPMVELNRCAVTAVELDADAVEILKGFCEAAHIANLDTSDWIDSIGDRDFDCVVAADVLEHLVEPARVLNELIGLARDRRVVVSLPHVGHNALVACLMHSNFRYGEWGLLDATHIRFFGLANIQALFEEAGLAIRRVEFVRIRPEATEFADVWGSLPVWKRAALASSRTGDVYQVVVEASDRNIPGPELDIKAECRATFYENQRSLVRKVPGKLREVLANR